MSKTLEGSEEPINLAMDKSRLETKRSDFVLLYTMSDLTEAERNQIIGLFKGGTTKANIIKMLGFSKTTIL
ncbi:hypothetical protein C1645_812343 [Glomus cerebriforme]|uniref:Uncharacterized protein n=1 Tax=Glomus cerebriforme TaxID=658196 RepID=A0A397TP29_9GLOM|nr:hypothetical protein C1645_812343 [Glomus cerebriforme]